MHGEHLPVLLAETLELLAPERGGLFVDATVGLGGHAAALLERSEGVQLLGVDRDPQALLRAADRLEEFSPRARLIEGNFHQLETLLGGLDFGGRALGPGSLSGVLADLGVSSLQLDVAERGFSFRRDGPLDMRMGPGGRTAADVVNGSSEGELEQIFRDYGEEWQARRIARAIGRARSEEPIVTTGRLRDVIARAKAGGGRERDRDRDREGRVDPATRVFQALRIEVNEELSGLEGFIEQTVRLLDQGGRLVIISYHSLEDRIVKNSLRDLARGQVDPVTGRPRSESQLIEVLTKKPVRPSEEEVRYNPRSRSARLRAARRL